MAKSEKKSEVVITRDTDALKKEMDEISKRPESKIENIVEEKTSSQRILDNAAAQVEKELKQKNIEKVKGDISENILINEKKERDPDAFNPVTV